MTEQNTAYRTDLEPSEDEDPLAELARIVAGEPANRSEPSRTQAPVHANSSSQDDEFDIENALMQELGGADDQPAVPEPDAVSAPVKQPTPFVSRATPVAPPESASLEDQLMAELGAHQDDANPMPDQDASVVDKVDDALVEEAVSNAVRDVEAASAEIGTIETDPFDQVEAAANAVRQEAAASAPLQDAGDDLEDFFADGFEDLLAEDESGKAEQADPQSAIPQPAANADGDIDLEDAFSAAFEQELAAREPEKTSPETVLAAPAPVLQQETVEQNAPRQDELALENEFAKSFADELGNAEPVAASPVDYGANAYSADQSDAFPEMEADPAYSGQMADTSEERGSSGGFKMAVGALGIALLMGMGVVGWSYYSGGGATEPVVVRADNNPAKVKPEDPGGEQIANQDNEVYNRVAGTQSGETSQEELITSRQETVVVPPKSDDRLIPESGAEETTAAAPLGISPKRVRTLTVKPDGTIVPAAGSEPQSGTGAEQETSQVGASDSDGMASTPAQEGDTGIIGIDGARTTGQLAVPEPSPLPAARDLAQASPPAQAETARAAVTPQPSAPAADPQAPTQIASLENQPAPTPAVTSSEWKIQVTSQRSREAAEASFTNLQRRFSSILGGRSAVIERADIEGKGTFYRTKVLAESRDEAGRLCSRLKSAGGSCFVTR